MRAVFKTDALLFTLTKIHNLDTFSPTTKNQNTQQNKLNVLTKQGNYNCIHKIFRHGNTGAGVKDEAPAQSTYGSLAERKFAFPGRDGTDI